MNLIDALTSGTFELGNAAAKLAQGQSAQNGANATGASGTGANGTGATDQAFSNTLELSLQQIAAGIASSEESVNVTNCVIVKPSENVEQPGLDFEDDPDRSADLAGSEQPSSLLMDQLLTFTPPALNSPVNSAPPKSAEPTAIESTDSFGQQIEREVPQVAPELKPPALPPALMQTGIPEIGSNLQAPKPASPVRQQAVPQKKSDSVAPEPIRAIDGEILKVADSSEESTPSVSVLVESGIQNTSPVDSPESIASPAVSSAMTAAPVVSSDREAQPVERPRDTPAISIRNSAETQPARVEAVPVEAEQKIKDITFSVTPKAKEPLPKAAETAVSDVRTPELGTKKSATPVVSASLNRLQSGETATVSPILVNPQTAATVAKQNAELTAEETESTAGSVPETVESDLSLKAEESASVLQSDVETTPVKLEVAAKHVENAGVSTDDDSNPDDETSRIGDKLDAVSSIANDKSGHASHVKHVSSNTDTPPDVNVGRVISDVSRGVTSARDAGHEIHLRLDPRELGGLQIHVAMQDGQLTARLEAERASSHRLLSDNLSQLRDQLTQQGVQVDRIEVVHIGERPGAGNAQAHTQSFRQQERQPQFAAHSESGRNLRRDPEPEQTTANTHPTPIRTSRAKIRELDITV